MDQAAQHQDWELTYVVPGAWGKPSLDPLESDAIANAAHMEQLVGTLTKMGAGGRYEPYLAESWEQSPDALSWRFKLIEGLTCSDGSETNAPSFVQSLQTVLRLYSASRSDIPVFNQLEGWQSFVEGSNDALGIRAVGNYELVFQFASKPKAGFLEYVSMPYFGFYCPSNFTDGRWKDPRSIISSGAYAFDSMNEDMSIRLIKREVDGESAPSKVLIKRLEKGAALTLQPTRTIIHTVLAGNENIPAHWKRLTGVPTNLIGFSFGYINDSPS